MGRTLTSPGNRDIGDSPLPHTLRGRGVPTSGEGNAEKWGGAWHRGVPTSGEVPGTAGSPLPGRCLAPRGPHFRGGAWHRGVPTSGEVPGTYFAQHQPWGVTERAL